MEESEWFGAMLHHSATLKLRLVDQTKTVLRIVTACEEALRQGGKLLFCGNGGSAADSQHLATELLIRLRPDVERMPLPAIALTLDPAMLTASGNDYGYERVFERPLRALGRPGDVLFGITTSGRSPNIIQALQTAREIGVITVGLCGENTARIGPHCDYVLAVPDDATARIQECHITLGHAILELLEDRIRA